MKISQLKEALALGESQTIEFKSDYKNISTIGKVICGFLNTSGGYIVCGANDQGDITGIDRSRSTLQKLEYNVLKDLSPKALVSFQIQDVEGKSVLVIEVPKGKDIPYAFRSIIYLREGQNTPKADIETIRDMVMLKQIEPERWERRFSSADVERDVDPDELHSAVDKIRKAHADYFRDISNPYMVLEDLAAARYGRLTNAGDILFCENPSVRYPQVRVLAVCFATDKTSSTYRDTKSIEGPLVSALEQTFLFILRNTPTISKFHKNVLAREDESLYPGNAIREALVNAFVHRNYSDSSGGIAVHIYPNRLEIWNSGALPKEVSLDKLNQGHISILRNPDIANVLYLRGLMEKVGRGILFILNLCQKNGLPAPKWMSNEKTGVTLTFFAPEVTPEVAMQVTMQVTMQDTTQDNMQVTPEVNRMLNIIKGEMSRQELQDNLKLKNRDYFRKAYLLPALDQGLIEMTIPDKPNSRNQRYRLTNKGRTFIKSRQNQE
ncbi:MAG: putative DNA binding domain-containing protein [Candidatus Marinimicrobia bacterium]|nr:putative DNA binding domain-containing protein [Candidatus Neomarinimicrobiota bacterium]